MSAPVVETAGAGGAEAGLNPRQMEAVNALEGPVLILAGAGSGKTRVITHRIARLLNAGVPAWSILALTFTNKAAAEMKERAMRLCGSAGEGMWISTFHSSCLRILRREAERIGYPRDFAVYDQQDQTRLIKNILEELGLDEKEHPARQLGSLISRYKSHLKGPEEAEAELGRRNKEFVEVFARYEARLATARCMDFDDLLGKLVRLLAGDPQARETYQRKFRHALVDEFQDTNAAQYRLLKLIMGENRNLCVVGDDDQSIYQWRGASVENLRDFEKDYPDARVILLEQNYRSTAHILTAANAVVERNPGRRGKKLWTRNGAGEKITLATVGDEMDEAALVARAISDLEAEGGRLNETAVFYRTNSQSRALEDGLRAEGIPHQVYGGLKFYDRKEVKDLLAYFNVALNPHDIVSFQRTVNTPPRGLGDVTIAKLVEHAAAAGLSPAQALDELDSVITLNAGARAKLASYREIIKTVRALALERPAEEAVRGALEATGYTEWLLGMEKSEAAARLENLDELVNAAADFAQRTGDAGMRAFLDQAALVADADNVGDAAGRGAVKLMTVHVSKGLEFDNVFVTGLEENVFPHARSKDDPAQMEEERRLLYVAMTRARKRLTLTHALRRRMLGVFQDNRPSRFLADLPAEAVARQVIPFARAADAGFMEYPVRRMRVKDEPEPSWPKPKAAEPRAAVEVDGLKVGMRVNHPTYQIGTLRGIEGKGENAKLTVYFPRFGEKKLVKRFAKLTALD